MFGAWTKDVWLVPINYCSHWSLLMVLNCGVNICSWAYVIATGRMEHFQERDMDNARKGIATYLVEAENEIKREKRCVKSNNLLLQAKNVNCTNTSLIGLIQKSNSCPFGFDNTVELCASLNLIINSD
ncbi:hypothetical protein ALC62_12894 [Cyphomyrmex costatus]|uniref:Ubiquitin-like protease family profile domain-containing protein n=1 Tax=Cyphomyrmex costatus TaxID=456900 RepID=A0A151IAH7_9HYME|nr:hypothetical protein ALC62_12894 [Cyphomyrmex costatus]